MKCSQQCLARSMRSPAQPGTEGTKVRSGHPLPKPRLQMEGRETSHSYFLELCRVLSQRCLWPLGQVGRDQRIRRLSLHGAVRKSFLEELNCVRGLAGAHRANGGREKPPRQSQ